MPKSDDIGKVFIGGLSWETTKEALQEYFSQYGEIVDSVVMKNGTTGKSRGFGFITFKDPNCVNAVLHSKPHELNGRIVDAKECTPRSMQKDKKGVVQGKVFLGGLPPDITETDIRTCMSAFGKVAQITIMSDPDTKKCRGFGFLSYESEDSINQACSQRFVVINGKQVECKRAEPRESRRGSFDESGYGDANGGGRQPHYSGGYEDGWNQVQQQYAMQAQAFGSYSGYGAGVVPYISCGLSYNGTPQYQPACYSANSTASYGYVQAPSPGVAQPIGHSYTTAVYPSVPAVTEKESNVTDSSYGYQQSQPSYGPTKNFSASSQKGFENGSGYNTASTGGRQGYHPYRR